MINRCKLGPVYIKSPAQNIRKWIVENFTKILWAIIICILWQATLYMVCGIINFVGGNVAEMWDRDTPTLAMYNHPWCAPFKVIGSILIIFYVFRSKTNRKH